MRDFKPGDKVIYESRKNGQKYIGVIKFFWRDNHGRDVVSVSSSTELTQERANPFLHTLELLTEEREMLWKLENV